MVINQSKLAVNDLYYPKGKASLLLLWYNALIYFG